jgi:hypothetical protein
MERVFQIAFLDSVGTAFAVDVDGRQYLITALHVCAGIHEGDEIRLLLRGIWTTLPATIVAQGNPDDPNDDYLVLAVGRQVAPAYDLPLDIGQSHIGANLWFLGFPYGMMSTLSLISGLTMPLIKHALLSGVQGTTTVEAFILDGMNNEGFSGGPVIFRRQHANADGQSVLGIISSYSAAETEVTLGGVATGMRAAINTGIIHCVSSQRVRAAIDANPIGVPVDPSWAWPAATALS